ncbi:MAG TPA: haloacid dehalogenase [Candidatus Competibacteraceae bacterium]|nr:haloacid dehalogenase [Candidatus Competibacteraceae bacterium]HPF58559.1 haloacid dehalogenase [Candidatus Competibacteraceae bacterium]HRY18276.1 haloacid dehalogenase [Candidatus Competibacteraceae bacterium]
MPRVIVFLDLDDTILQTALKCPPDQPLAPAAFNRAGEVLSFMTRAQQRLLGFWLEQGVVIPVTGRTDDALARVAIAFTSWRITHHGAVIRQPDGSLPAWWFAEVQPALVAAQPLLRNLSIHLSAGAAGDYRVSNHSVDKWLTYISVKADDDGGTLTRLALQLEQAGLPPELALHCNGNNLALTVRGAQKQDAVRRVAAELQREGPIVTIGAGDSLTDLPFMQSCDFALTPRGSQIQNQTWNEYA